MVQRLKDKNGSEPIHVVHLLHTIAYGGVETILINWLKRLEERSGSNVKLSLVCFSNADHSENAFLEAARAHHIQIDTIPWSRRKPMFSSGRKLAKIVKARGADIIHTHNTYADLTGLVASKLTGARTVSSVYVWSDFGWKRNLLQWINQWALKGFHAVTAQCRTTLTDTCARGIAPAKVCILPSGFELNTVQFPPAERSALRRAWGAEDQDIVLINVARLYPEKAQEQLLTTFKTALGAGLPLKLWILGVGPLDAQLKDMAKKLGLDAEVRFLGFRDDLHRVLKLADIQVHPSFAEGIPMSILSGMASALPIVASDVGGISEVLEDNRNGILVPSAADPQFASKFVKAILTLAREPGARQRIGTAAAHFIRDEYSIDAALRKLEELYRRVLAE